MHKIIAQVTKPYLPDSRDIGIFINSLDPQTRSQYFPDRYRLDGAIFIYNSNN